MLETFLSEIDDKNEKAKASSKRVFSTHKRIAPTPPFQS